MSILVETFFKKEALEKELEDLGLSKDEKETLLKTVEDMARYRVLNSILDKLESEDKELFLRQLHSGSESMMVEHLREKIENFEEIVRGEIKDIEEEVLSDIKKLKEQS